MLRYTLDKLKTIDKLLECNVPVDSQYELGGVLKHFNNKMPIVFNNINGYKTKAVGGLYGDREVIYNLLGTDHENRIDYFTNAIVNPQPYKVLENGPVRENIIKGNIDLGRSFPITKFQEKDNGSYITAGVLVIKDPETGKYHTSIRRFQFNGRNQISILIASSKLTNDFLDLEKINKPMEVAIILGYDAEFLMASQISSKTYGLDKYQVDSALRGEALELVKCESVDLLVPAYSEIVFEGVIVPNKREIEGPFGELMGYYGDTAPHPVVEVGCITHRNDPIFQVAFPCREEHVSNGLIREIELYTQVNNQIEVVDVNVTEGGGYRFNAIVSIDKKSEGEGKSAILSSLGVNKDYKQVVIVDKDVNIFDIQDVEWAITTRSQATEDYVIVKGALGSTLEPSHGLRGVTDKVGIDATKPLNDPEEKFERAEIPKYEKVDITRYFKNLK